MHCNMAKIMNNLKKPMNSYDALLMLADLVKYALNIIKWYVQQMRRYEFEYFPSALRLYKLIRYLFIFKDL